MTGWQTSLFSKRPTTIQWHRVRLPTSFTTGPIRSGWGRAAGETRASADSRSGMRSSGDPTERFRLAGVVARARPRGDAEAKMVHHREPTPEEMKRLGAEDGRALAAGLAFYVRDAVTQKHVDEMLQVVNRGITRMSDDLRTGGLSEALVLAYGTACSEAIMHEMACHARAAGRQRNWA
jgi:hypothetical protein